jgi:hypothetical protein
MAFQDSALDCFTEFVTRYEARLSESLMATCGRDAGRDAAAEALMFTWDNLDRLEAMVSSQRRFRPPLAHVRRRAQTA